MYDFAQQKTKFPMEQPHMLQLSFTVNTTPADALAT